MKEALWGKYLQAAIIRNQEMKKKCEGRAWGEFASVLDSTPQRIATFTAESIYAVECQANRFSPLIPDS